MPLGTSESRYLVEVDGVTALDVSEVSGFGKKHTPFKLSVGNRPSPILGRGNFEIEEVTFKHAHALNNAGQEFMQWLEDFTDGIDTSRRSARVIVLDEDGQSPVAQYELLDCVPTSFKIETHTAGGNNPSYFSFMLMPENMRS
jgi:phage tail-like protein